MAIEEDRIDEAIEILEPKVKGYNPEPDSLVYLGIAYVQADRPKDAIKVLRRAQDMVEDHCVVALFLGRALRGVGKLDEAEEELRRAISLDSDEPENWSELGKLLYDKGTYKEDTQILELKAQDLVLPACIDALEEPSDKILLRTTKCLPLATTLRLWYLTTPFSLDFINDLSATREAVPPI